MTEQAPSKPTARAARRRASLYRRVLSLAVAAVVAAWLPFSVLYVNALSNRAATVSAVYAPRAGSGAPTRQVVTTASGRVVPSSATAGSTPVAQTAGTSASLATRSS
jgi:hypothetical protein